MQIRSISRMLFQKQYDEEVYSEYKEWIPYVVDLYASIRDSETGDFRFLPFSGSLMDQPYKSMQILKAVQAAYREVAEEKNKALMEKAKANKR